jgi:hypothetical protein
VVADLQSAAIIEATGGPDDDFNPATATLDECKAYLARMGVRLRGESRTD